MKKISILFFSLFIILCLTSCVMSKNPLGNKEDAIDDPRLLGVWQRVSGLYYGGENNAHGGGVEEIREYGIIAKGENNNLVFFITDEMGRVNTVYDAYVSKIGDESFFNIESADEDPQEGQEYLLLHYNINDENELVVSPLDRYFFKSAIKKRKLKGKYDEGEIEKGKIISGSGPNVYLTDTTQNIARLIRTSDLKDYLVDTAVIYRKVNDTVLDKDALRLQKELTGEGTGFNYRQSEYVDGTIRASAKYYFLPANITPTSIGIYADMWISNSGPKIISFEDATCYVFDGEGNKYLIGKVLNPNTDAREPYFYGYIHGKQYARSAYSNLVLRVGESGSIRLGITREVMKRAKTKTGIDLKDNIKGFKIITKDGEEISFGVKEEETATKTNEFAEKGYYKWGVISCPKKDFIPLLVVISLVLIGFLLSGVIGYFVCKGEGIIIKMISLALFIFSLGWYLYFSLVGYFFIYLVGVVFGVWKNIDISGATIYPFISRTIHMRPIIFPTRPDEIAAVLFWFSPLIVYIVWLFVVWIINIKARSKSS